MKASNEHEARLIEREKARRICERAIGCPISVRDTVRYPRGNAVVKGIIVSAEPASFRYTRSACIMQFRVTVEAGANKTRHTFLLSRLPQSSSSQSI